MTSSAARRVIDRDPVEVGSSRHSPDPAQARAILHPGRNCWRLAKCSRAAVLVDGDAYYQALASSFENAERAIYMVGWDFNSRVRLKRAGAEKDARHELANFLNELVQRKRHLQIYVLAWDFAMLFALEREFLPLYRFGFRTHRRVHFRMDDSHPFGGSQHQKIAVVDDRVAFCGGLDVTACRWDTPEHRAVDARRCDAGMPPHEPFHDVQMVVEGDVAASLGALVRERWRRATGNRLAPPAARSGPSPWPAEVAPAIRDIAVGIARTEPPHRGHSGVHEVAVLHRDLILAAERHIYIENQYFTSDAIVAVLARKLREEHGPEIVIVGPQICTGWLEQRTMGALRAGFLAKLREADVHGRLGTFYPRLPAHEGHRPSLTVHSKVLVIDDRLLRIGSSNLSNRSMGLDSECDLVVEALDDRTRSAVREVRERLLAEHLGTDIATVARTFERTGTLLATIQTLGSGERGLEPIDEKECLPRALPALELVDPAEPVEIEGLAAQILLTEHDAQQSPTRVRILWGSVAFAALIALWLWSPVAPWRMDEPGRVATPVAFDLVMLLLLYVVGSATFIPLSLLTIGCVWISGIRAGLPIALLGTWIACALGYLLGRVLRRDMVRAVAGRTLGLLRERLGPKPSMRTVARVRLSPTIPFAVANLVAGASRVPFRAYLAGSVLAGLPIVVALSLFAATVRSALAISRAVAIERAALGALLLALGLLGLRVLAARLRRAPSRRRAARSRRRPREAEAP